MADETKNVNVFFMNIGLKLSLASDLTFLWHPRTILQPLPQNCGEEQYWIRVTVVQ